MRIIVLVIGVVSTGASAFEFAEHESISNDALRVALATAAAPSRVRFSDNDRIAVERFLTSRDDGESFGWLVGITDYVTEPSQFFLQSGSIQPPRLGAERQLDWAGLRRKQSSLQQYLFAAHLNENHFQQNALATFVYWHDVAVSVARHDRNIVVALVYEAYAVHFLEDFFAPGHIMTPRAHLHDLPSRALHNYYNRVGRGFHPANLDELNLLSEDSLEPKKRFRSCDHTDLEMITLYGDGKVDESRCQRPLMTSVVARSILDVLYAAANIPDSTLTLAHAFYQPYRYREEGRGNVLMSPEACIHYGCYAQDPSRHGRSFGGAFAIDAGFRTISAGQGAAAELCLDWLFAGSAGPDWIDNAQIRLPQAAIAVGGSALWQPGHFVMPGAQLRVIVPFSQVGLQAGPVLHARFARVSGDWLTAPGAEIRLEGGFGLLFFGIGAGWMKTPAGDHLVSAFSAISTVSLAYAP